MQSRLRNEGSDQWLVQADYVMDEIEAITTDLDSLLAQANPSGVS